MTKINNIEKLRNYLLDSIELCEKKKIKIDELSIIAKTAEAIFSSVKIQLVYNQMRNEKPSIDFIEECNKGIADEKVSKTNLIRNL